MQQGKACSLQLSCFFQVLFKALPIRNRRRLHQSFKRRLHLLLEMSFYSARVLKALTGQSGPTSVYQVQQSLKRLRGPQTYEVRAFTLEESAGRSVGEVVEPQTTHWQYVKLRKTQHMRVGREAVLLFIVMLPYAINKVNETRYTMESLSKEDPRNSVHGSSRLQDDLE